MDASYFDDEANASGFARYHVRLPDEVYRYMASLCEPNNEISIDGHKAHGPNRKLAIDLACGSGHSTVPIAKYFQEVIGVDMCRSLIKYAPKDVPNIRYKVGPAEYLDFVEDSSVDLVLTVSALHWLEVPQIYEEVKRVLRKGGVFCACDYTDFGYLYDIPEAGALWNQVNISYDPSNMLKNIGMWIMYKRHKKPSISWHNGWLKLGHARNTVEYLKNAAGLLTDDFII